MEEYVEVMRRTLELADTCTEGLNYISSRLEEGLMEETLYLLDDVVCGFCQIANSIQILESFSIGDQLIDRTTKVEMALHNILTAYEQHDINIASYSLDSLLLPAFQLWSNELLRSFHPHILS